MIIRVFQHYILAFFKLRVINDSKFICKGQGIFREIKDLVNQRSANLHTCILQKQLKVKLKSTMTQKYLQKYRMWSVMGSQRFNEVSRLIASRMVNRCTLEMNGMCRSRWPRGLRCGNMAVYLLGLWVQIKPGA